MKSSFFYLVVWALLLVAVFAGYGYWYATIARMSTAAAETEHQIDLRIETSSRIALARTTLVEIAGDEEAIRGHFVPETGVVAFIGELEALARSQVATVKVRSVSTSDDTKNPTLILLIAVEGTFDAVMRTIGVIEYAPYDLSLSKVSLSKSDKNLWHADLDLIVGSVSNAHPTPSP